MSEFEDRVRELMRDVSADDARRTPPPPSIWDAIADEVAADAVQLAPDPVGPDEQDGPPHSADLGRPTPLAAHARRRRLTTWTLGVAAAIVVAVGAAVVVDQRRAGDPDVIAAIEVSSDGLADAPAGLAARAVIEESDGVRHLTLDASAVTVGEGEFLELWLINDDITDMVSLGMIRRGDTYEIPADVELAAFPIIDVSIEPDDGVPTHSGRSVLRGRLDA